MKPLDRRRLELDEDRAPAWSEAELAAFADAAKRREAQRDMRQRQEGQELLAEYVGRSPADALRAFVHDLLGGHP